MFRLRRAWTFLSVVAGMVVMAVPSLGQGLIIDRRPDRPIAGSFEVRKVEIDARVRDQVAEVQITQTFHNPNSFDLESEFLFPVPDDGGIQNFVFLVDGKELPGRLLTKDEARKIYEEIVRRKRDPALLEYMGQGVIRTSVFPIPPHADRTVTLRYTRLCKRDGDVVEFAYPLSTQRYSGKPIERLEITARLESKEPIKSIYSPDSDVEIDRDGDHRATVRLRQCDVVPERDFRLIYTLQDGAVGASVLSYKPSDGEDGYVLVLASPEVPRESAERASKSVVFVLDRSGSMTGKKIEQARNALKFVMKNLREGDTFNILTYDDRVEMFRPELQRYDARTRDEALGFVENIRPGGSTNIDDALRDALKLVTDRDRPSYVLFLTDGLPTAGNTNEAEIAKHAKEANRSDARIFVFGVGDDVNARLLDRLSGGNGGTSEYVRPEQDIEAAVSRFFRKMTSPVLSDLKLVFEGRELNRGYPRDIPDLFEGGQIVWVGRYPKGGGTELTIEGRIGGERKRHTFPVELARDGDGGSYRFVETLWAVRRVGDLIDQIDLQGQNRELIDELVALSKRHGILTPYTSFLADETTDLNARGANVRLTEERLERLREVEGRAGVAQREYKAMAKQADRFRSLDSLASAPVPLSAATPASGRSAGSVGGGGLGGMAAGGPAPARNAAAVVAHNADGEAQVVGSVRRIGDKTFYRRGETWIDSTVTPEQEKKARRVEQFSEAYFELARSQGSERNQYLTFEEPVIVNLGGETYRIDRAAK